MPADRPATHDVQEQLRIGAELGVKPQIDAQAEIASRVDFIAGYLRQARGRALVLGISGGIDSTTAGRLCQLAVQKLRDEGYEARFIAVRLPHGAQRDESDAQEALRFIAADEVLTVDVKPSSDGMLRALLEAGLKFADEGAQDVAFGNVKARERMIAQYAIAAAHGGLVVGTDHAAEAVMGFFTKHGDGACDLTPLTGLTKRQVRLVGAALGAPRALVEKVPTADLEELCPLRPDEDCYGVSYSDIDDFLEGKAVTPRVAETVLRQYRITAHKRALPATPPSVS